MDSTQQMHKNFLITGSFLAATGVALGAFGAHALKDAISEDHFHAFQTGVQYQFYHALALLIVAMIAARVNSKYIAWSGYLFISGTLLFSGSLYCLAVFPALSWAGAITPLGGLSFIAGWTCLVIFAASLSADLRK
jgi:uncharacterized membrane protein YgdD (TMEM256/DUF423 family)